MADYLFCARRHLLDWITPSAVPGGGSVWRGRLGNKGEALQGGIAWQNVGLSELTAVIRDVRHRSQSFV